MALIAVVFIGDIAPQVLFSKVAKSPVQPLYLLRIVWLLVILGQQPDNV